MFPPEAVGALGVTGSLIPADGALVAAGGELELFVDRITPYCVLVISGYPGLGSARGGCGVLLGPGGIETGGVTGFVP